MSEYAIKLEHRPNHPQPWEATMWKGNTYLVGTLVTADTRADALAKCEAAHRRQYVETQEWVPFDPREAA